MPRPPRRLALAGLALAAASTAALAHDTWLLPTRAAVPPGVEVGFDLTSGMAFPANETAIQPARVAAAHLRLADTTAALPAPRAAAQSLRFRVPLRRAGVATVWVDLAARDLELAPAEVRGYLTEVGAPDSVRRAYEAQPAAAGGTRRWRERYAKHAKTFVRVASPLRPLPAADSSWRVPVGSALELVPERDPTALRAGDTLRLRLVRAGTPVPLHPVGFVGGGAKAGVLRRTDAVGRATFVVPRGGRWLARATLLRRAADPALDWESDFATLTFVAR